MTFFKTNQKFLQNILAMDSEFSSYNTKDLSIKFQSLGKKNLNDTSVIQTAFAITREMSYRILGLKHFPTQLLGGLVLHKGEIVEMKTGEGKTLVATLAASLNALSGKGIHVVTVNEYLAKRDALTMGKVYNALGLTTGLILENSSGDVRRNNYKSDITYVTNSELGFDFLRDNCVKDLKDRVLRPFHYCIIDEVDSVLIDEARNPLIIADKQMGLSYKYQEADIVASCLEEKIDFCVDRKIGQISLTDQGIVKIELLLNIPDLYSMSDPWIPFLINALKAQYLFQRNKEYVILDNKICIVDEFTGRIMTDRRWSGGLHQAIEAKEGLSIQPTTKTLASITYQNFFVRYPRISGMTGTAKTSQEEFKTIYGLPVTVLPTSKPLQRIDLPDLVYKDELSKWKAVAEECIVNYAKGRPVLIGTTSVKNSEILSEILSELQIPHQLLNARPENIRRESEIIAQAGEKYSITIATNMAGRGTDIILGGNLKYLIIKQIKKFFHQQNLSSINDPILKNLINDCWQEIKSQSLSNQKVLSAIEDFSENSYSPLGTVLAPLYGKISELYYPDWLKNNKEVIELGGLYVIGTERHESSRIDNQLRGRSGRQGDPGLSRFFLSLEDDLLQTFGGDRIQNLMKTLNFDSNQPLESPFLSNSVTQAQKKVESFYYESRKRVFEYDEVLNLHRDFLFQERLRLLETRYFLDILLQYSEEFILEEQSRIFLQQILSFEIDIAIEKNISPEWLTEQLWISQDLHFLAFESFGGWVFDSQKEIFLNSVDVAWMQHLENMDILRDSIGWKGYEQRDPLLIYKEESYQLFLNMIEQVQVETMCGTLLIPFNML